MGKKKNFNDGESKEKMNKKNQDDQQQEYAEMPPGWKEPAFTKEDNPHGTIVDWIGRNNEFYFCRTCGWEFICNVVSKISRKISPRMLAVSQNWIIQICK